MFYFILGYAFCVIFPIPWLNSNIIAFWARLYVQIEAWVKGVAITQRPIVPPRPTDAPTKREHL